MVRLPLVLLVGTLFSHVSFAQTGEVLRLDVVVSAHKGGALAGLQQGDFVLLDNKQARPITSFREVSHDAPAEAVLVLDAVNSGAVSLGYQRQQLNKFLTANGGRLPLPTTLAILTDKGVETMPGSTRDGTVLAGVMSSKEIGLRFVTRSSGFYGAEERLSVSLTGMRQLAQRESARPGRKLMIWLSPGWPIISGFSVDYSAKEHETLFREIVQVSTLLRRSGVVVYCVDPIGAGEGVGRKTYYQNFTKGISKPSQTEAGDLALQTLAQQSGGLVLNSGNDIAAMLTNAMADAGPYYELTFEGAPAERSDEYHAIEVKVDRAGLKARTREGYYAQPLPAGGGGKPDGALNQ